jgi:hypothetical protein
MDAALIRKRNLYVLLPKTKAWTPKPRAHTGNIMDSLRTKNC